jgi:hydrogenase 3 maturation protease
MQIWQTLLPVGANEPPVKFAILAVGNEFNGDDAAGVLFSRVASTTLESFPQALILEAGLAPQNLTGLLRRFEPEKVIIVDAAEMDLQTGSAVILDPAEIDGLSISTHTFPLSMLANYLQSEIHCQVHFIGIQPKSNLPFSPLSPAVQQSVLRLARSLTRHLAGSETNKDK